MTNAIAVSDNASIPCLRVQGLVLLMTVHVLKENLKVFSPTLFQPFTGFGFQTEGEN